MKKILSLIVALMFVVCLAGCGNVSKTDKPSEPEPPKLEDVVDFVLDVPAGRDVVLLQLTDIQIIDSAQQRYDGRLKPWSVEPWAPERMEERAFVHMREIVERVKPDLIVLSGDNVYGEFDDAGTSLTALIAEIESYKIPWTLTFGNHDNETRKGVEWTCEQYMSAEHCMFTRGPIADVHGNGNFNIGITQDGKLTEVVWLMDSNGHTDSDSDQNMYSRVGLFDDQIEWFTKGCEKIREFNGGTSPKSIGFFHHPTRAVADGLKKYGYVSGKHGFEDGDRSTFTEVIVPQNDSGDCGAVHGDAAAYIDQDYVLHKLLKQYNGEGWFFGHEHINNASVKFEGIRYTYGLKASEYDSFIKGEIGGTRILLGADGLRVNHEYVTSGS